MRMTKFRLAALTAVAAAVALAVACGSEDAAPAPQQPQPTQAPQPAATSKPAPTAAVPTRIVAPTSVAAPTAAPAATPTPRTAPPVDAGPSGKVTVALSSIGPRNYELYQLVWPWNDRNQFMGVYDTLFYDDRRTGAASLLNPSVASAWRFTDAALVLTIRSDVAWHQTRYGNVTVPDVLHSMERSAKEGTKWTRAEAFTTNFKVGAITQTGPNEITLPWNKRDLRWRSVPRDITLQSLKFFQEAGPDDMNLTPMGTGPYKVLDHQSDNIMRLEATDKHFRDRASVKFIDVLDTPEETVRVAMLKTGQADIIQMGMPSIPAIKQITGAQLLMGPATGLDGAQIVPSGQYYQTAAEDGKATARTPLTQLPWVGTTPDKGLKVRQAMSMAIDRQALVDTVLGGLGQKHYHWNLGPGHPRWTPELEKKFAIPYDVAAAKKLLAEAGHANGFNFTFFIPSGLSSTLEQVCQAMIPMFSAAGMNATVDKSAYSSVRPKMLARSIDVVWCWQESGWSVDPDVLYRFSTRAVWNPGIEYNEPLDFESRILSKSDAEESWKIIIDEWLPWFQKTLPSFQTVGFAAPIAVGGRIKEWPMRVHSNRWPMDPFLIRLASGS